MEARQIDVSPKARKEEGGCGKGRGGHLEDDAVHDGSERHDRWAGWLAKRTRARRARSGGGSGKTRVAGV